jgi:hypothetical protein
VKASDFLDAYQKWSGDKFMTQKAFAQRLREKNFEGKKGLHGCVFYRGIGLEEVPNAEDREGF